MTRNGISINYTLVECIYNKKGPNYDPTTIANFDAYFLISSAICWTLGTALWSGVLHYEWFGGDPQKRSLGNRLISNGVITQASSLAQFLCHHLVHKLLLWRLQ